MASAASPDPSPPPSDIAATVTVTTTPGLPGLLTQRRIGQVSSLQFRNTVIRQRASSKHLSRHTRIFSTEPSVTALQFHPIETRFLLTGSTTGRCNIYDLSRYGGGRTDIADNMHNTSSLRQSTTIRTHQPIAQTNPLLSRRTGDDGGHSAEDAMTPFFMGPITTACWYPADSGIFLSSHVSGHVRMWDTNSLEPVLRVQPFASDLQRDGDYAESYNNANNDNTAVRSAVVTTMAPNTHTPHLVAVASVDVPKIRLVDLRTGSTAHTLTGHRRGGVTALAWAPTVGHVLASGGADGTIRLWDVRQAGRYAWLGDGPLDAHAAATGTYHSQDNQNASGLVRVAYRSDYSHWKKRLRRQQSFNKSSAATKAKFRSPNDFTEDKTTQSHEGSVTALAFSHDGHYLFSCADMNEQESPVTVWDMDTRRVVPRSFTGARRLTSRVARQRTQLIVQPQDCTVWMSRGLFLYQYDWQTGGPPKQRLTGHLKRINAMDMDPETGNLVTGGADGVVLVWDSSTQIHQNGGMSSTGRSRKRRASLVDRDNW